MNCVAAANCIKFIEIVLIKLRLITKKLFNFYFTESHSTFWNGCLFLSEWKKGTANLFEVTSNWGMCSKGQPS